MTQIPDKEIIFAGRFIEMKNLETLISAFAKIQDPQFRLVLIGSGPTESLLRNQVEQLSLQSRVEFLPNLSQPELYKRIMNCYLFVIPSWTDISPNQAFECLALSIPVLLTKENYLPFAKELPLAIDPHSADQITQTINSLLDKNNYQRYAAALSTIHPHHSWDMVLVDHMKVFKNVLH